MYNSKPSVFEKLTIQSADGSKTADIDGGAFLVTYYENLFSPIVTAKINVVNTGDSIRGKDGKMQSIYNGFPLRGGERVVLKIAGNSDVNQLYEEMSNRVPMGKVGEEIDYANLVAFLSSDRSAYITGTAINVDGGLCPVV